MKNTETIAWIAVDWGTTHLRTYGLSSDNQSIVEAASNKGMGVLAQNEFEPALLELINDWLPETGKINVLACGMVGARQGWQEAPYLTMPCFPFSVKSLTAVKTNHERIHFSILPGISQSKPADVMRGEETQLAGLLNAENNNSARVCLPGTHSKWVTLEKGKVTKFSTYMTGEMFDILCKNSILRHQINHADWNYDSFIGGVKCSLEQPNQLLNECFSIRAEGLLNKLENADARSRLSGLLIGSELLGTKEYWQDHKIVLIGDKKLTELYAQALSILFVKTEIYDPTEITLKGLIKVYQKILSQG